MEIDMEQLKTDVMKIAGIVGVAESDVAKVLDVTIADLTKRGIPAERIEQQAWLRVQASLKRKQMGVSNTNWVPGFIMARSGFFDGSKKPREEAAEYVREFGTEAALTAGYMNAEGKLLYKDFDWRMGKVIPDTDWKANGLAILDIEGKAKFANVNFRGAAATDEIDLFKLCQVPIYTRENRKDSIDVTVSNLPKEYATEYEDFNKYAELVKEAAENKILPSLKDVGQFIKDNTIPGTNKTKFGSWCIVEGNVIEIGTLPDRPDGTPGATAVSIDDQSLKLDEDGDNVPHMTVFFPPNVKIDFNDFAYGVTFIVNPYLSKKDNKVTLSGMGYWVDPSERVDNMSLGETEIQDPWG